MHDDSESVSSSDWEMENRIRPSTDKRNKLSLGSSSDESSEDEDGDINLTQLKERTKVHKELLLKEEQDSEDKGKRVWFAP